MASLGVRALSRGSAATQLQYRCPRCRYYAVASLAATTATPPPLLVKLRKDLKTAMLEKDTNRLSVLRSLIADVTNAAKSNTPIKTDMQLLSLLRKRQAAANQAKQEFEAAGRKDLVEKEEGQVVVLEQYAESMDMLSADEIRDAVMKAVDQAKEQQSVGNKTNMGDVLKKVLGTGGSLDGKAVDRREVTRIVKEVMTLS